MKVTFDFDEALTRLLAEEAVRRRTTMSALVEAGLRRILSEPESVATHPDSLPPSPSWKSGGFRIDIADRDEQYGIAGHETSGHAERSANRKTGTDRQENELE